jgi:hypothetical protein
MERMAGDVEKRDVSTGGNGREAEAERVIPGRRIIGTGEWSQNAVVLQLAPAHGCRKSTSVQRCLLLPNLEIRFVA